MLNDLHRAVRSGDPLAARRAARDAESGAPDQGHGQDTGTDPAVAPDRRGQVLETLARLAAEGGDDANLATELLLEALDSSGMVHRFAHQALLDAAAVDDVAQDSLISIAESIGSFRGQSQVSTWVHRIVRHRVVDHLRRQRATAPLPDDDVGPGERMSSRIATRATITDVLGSLPEQYREPVVLRDVQGLPYAEIADRLNLSLSATKSRIARGRAMVAARWHQDADQVEGPGGAGG